MTARRIARICSIENCDRKVHGQKMCMLHYMRHRQTTTQCMIVDCERQVVGRGWCGVHYERWQRHGDPLKLERHSQKGRICVVDTCNRYALTCDLCAKHYSRWKKYGDPTKVKFILGDDTARFWSYVEKTDGCWLWKGQTTDDGYGRIRIAGKNVFVHRYSFVMHYGYEPLPACLHNCDTRNCVNPLHLRAGTSADNTADMMKRGRNKTVYGENVGTAKLTAAKVLAIRSSTLPYSKLSVEYDISIAQLSQIKNRKAWKHI